jgi:hypothetical protein
MITHTLIRPLDARDELLEQLRTSDYPGTGHHHETGLAFLSLLYDDMSSLAKQKPSTFQFIASAFCTTALRKAGASHSLIKSVAR